MDTTNENRDSNVSMTSQSPVRSDGKKLATDVEDEMANSETSAFREMKSTPSTSRKNNGELGTSSLMSSTSSNGGEGWVVVSPKNVDDEPSHESSSESSQTPSEEEDAESPAPQEGLFYCE